MPSHRDWLRQEPFTLALSAGFFGFFAHTGFISALEIAGVLPERVVGVSAGALAGGIWASGVPTEELANRLASLRRSDFWDPGLPVGGLLKGERFARLLEEIVRVELVEEMPVTFASVAHDLWRHRTEVLDRGPLVRAIYASCAVPLLFRPVRINRAWLVDGGLSDRVGFAAAVPGERLLVHYLPSNHRQSRQVREETAAVLARPNCLAMVDAELPRLGPFKLERGPEALTIARERAMHWLAAPAADGP